MKTIVKGKIPVVTYRGTCKKCGEVMETNDRTELKERYNSFDMQYYLYFTCPTCREIVHFFTNISTNSTVTTRKKLKQF